MKRFCIFALPNQPPFPMTETNQNPAKVQKLGCLGWLLSIVLPLLVAGPLFALCYSFYKDGHDPVDLFLCCLCFAFYVGAVIYFAAGLKKSTKPGHSGNRGQKQASILMGGLMGGYFLNKALNKNRKTLSDKARDDLFWQEKYRRHDH